MDNDELPSAESFNNLDQKPPEEAKLVFSTSEEQPIAIADTKADVLPENLSNQVEGTEDVDSAVTTVANNSGDNLKESPIEGDATVASASDLSKDLSVSVENLPLSNADSAESNEPEPENTTVNEGEKTDEKSEENKIETEERELPPVRRTPRTRKANTKYIEDEDFEEPNTDPSFTPEDGDYQEGSPYISEGSEEDFVVGKSKKKAVRGSRRPSKGGGHGRKKSASKPARAATKGAPKRRGRKPKATKNISPGPSLSRESRRKSSKTTYFEELSDDDGADNADSDDDYEETFTEHRPAARQSARRKSAAKTPRQFVKEVASPAKRRSTPRRESANRQSYDESLLESSDDDLPLVDGQPQLKPQKPKHRQRSTQSIDTDEGKNEQQRSWSGHEQGTWQSSKPNVPTSCFMVKKESHAALQAVMLSNGQAQLDGELFIWKQEGQLLQKFVQMGDSQKFKATSNYLGYFAESKNDFVPIDVRSLAKEHNMEIVKLKGAFDSNGDADISESDRIKNSMKSGLANKQSKAYERAEQLGSSDTPEPTRKRGRPRKSSGDYVPAPTTKRKKSATDDSAPPRKRGRPRKNPVVSIENIAEPMDTSEPKPTDSSKSSFMAALEVLLKAAVDGHNLEAIADSDKTNLHEFDTLINDLAEAVLGIKKLNAEYLEAMKSLPVMLQESSHDQQQCQATDEDLAVALVVILSGKAYVRDTLVTSDNEEEIVKKFFVSDGVGKISQAFHDLHHFKFDLFNKCVRKLKENATAAAGNFPSLSEDFSSSTGNERPNPGQTTDAASDVRVEAAVNDVLRQVVQSCIGDLSEGGVADGKTSDALDNPKIVNCLNDKAWVDRLFNQFSAILSEAEDLLKKPDDNDVIPPEQP